MDPENVLRLRAYRQEMEGCLEFDVITPSLIENNILTAEEYDRIKITPGNFQKVKKCHI